MIPAFRPRRPKGRSPYGERGLKLKDESVGPPLLMVAPPMGSVD